MSDWTEQYGVRIASFHPSDSTLHIYFHEFGVVLVEREPDVGEDEITREFGFCSGDVDTLLKILRTYDNLQSVL